MNTQNTGPSKINPQTPAQNGFGNKLWAALLSLAQPAPQQHVGMFAGSLLPYASWAQPKTPH